MGTSSAPSTLQARSLQDVYYAPLTRSGATDEELLSAGFFEDTLEGRIQAHPSWDTALRTTPTHKVFSGLRRTLKQQAHKPGLVLLCTGSFSPVHQGHLRMLEAARQALEDRGHRVVAGYLSPSHDQYVGVKRNGTCALHVEQRIALLKEAVRDSDWLHVCPWEGRYAPVALNFTDVYARLQAYLRQHVCAQLEVVYVFGSDNADFFKAFLEQGRAVCVERASHALARPLPRAAATSERIHFVKAADAQWTTASSTQVRQGQWNLLPVAARKRYEQAKGSLHAMTSTSGAKRYLLREDLDHGVSHWRNSASSPGLDQACARFTATLKTLLQAAVAPGVQVQSMCLEQQRKLVGQWIQEGVPLLSLDPCLKTPFQLEVSRLFRLSDGQVRSGQVIARPGRLPLERQLVQLKQSGVREFIGVDDDQSTGGTVRNARALLKSMGLALQDVRFLNERCMPESELSEVEDVVDARDFLLGAADAGLVVHLELGLEEQGAVARVPYMLPYTNLVFRARVLPEQLKLLSASLWQANMAFFSEMDEVLRVCDADPATGRFLRAVGFADETPLAEVCQYHLGAMASH